MATTLGIDIGHRTLRGALIKTGMRNTEVERYVEVPIPSPLPGTSDMSGLHSAVQTLFQRLGTTPDSVITALDGSRASMRTISIPVAAKKRAAEVLPFELDPLLPFPVEEALVDYQEVRVHGTDVVLLAAAVPELAVQEELERQAQLNLFPRELAVGAASLDGLVPFLRQPPDEAWLLLHLDVDSSDVCVIRDGSCELSRTLDEGIESLTERPTSLRTAVSQTMMKYRSEGGPLISKILLMGERSHEQSVVDQLSQDLGILLECVDLPATKGGGSAGPQFGKALALAGRITRRGKRLDMRKGRFAPPRGMSQLRDYAVLATCCALALIFSYSFRVWAEYRVLGEERDALQEQLAAVSNRHFGEATRSPKRARELLDGGSGAKDPLPRFDALRVLGAISAAVPLTITHDTRKLEITLDETGQSGKFELQGQIPDLTARDQVADALDAHECIEQLERGKTSTVPGQERKSYTLSGTISCPGANTAKAKSSQSTRGGR